MKVHNLNQVAVWVPMKSDELDIKVFTEYNFSHKGIIHQASTLKPVYRYAKNYYDGTNKFSLCMITDEKDTEAIDAFFNKVGKDLKYDASNGAFYKTEIYYGK